MEPEQKRGLHNIDFSLIERKLYGLLLRNPVGVHPIETLMQEFESEDNFLIIHLFLFISIVYVKNLVRILFILFEIEAIHSHQTKIFFHPIAKVWLKVVKRLLFPF